MTRRPIKSAYKLYTVSGVSEDLANDLLKKYPYLKQGDMYELSSVSKKVKKNVSALFEKAGLTKEQIEAEYTKIGYESDDHLPSFTVTMKYVLEDDGLKTSVSMDDVSYQKQYYQVDSLSVLPYFGCGQIEDTTGELLMPDGSGTILRYNSQYSKRLTSLSKRVYGEDAAEDADHSDFSTSQDVRLPVFGNKSSQGSYLAVIEDGESICSITASSGDASDHYPTAYATVKYRYNELFYYNDKDFSKNMMAYAEYHNAGTVSVKYMPLKVGANYVDMAFAYKNYLVDHGVFTITHTGSRFIMQLLGYVNNDDGSFCADHI